MPAPNGDLYVSDGYRNARVHRFSRDGQLKQSWGEPGKGGPGEFHLPHSIVAHPNGNLYLCDRENNRMQIYSPDGEFITMWEDMRRPLDISIDSEGALVISEGGVNGMSPRVSIMDPDGNVLARWDSESAHGSWVDAEGNIYMALGAQERVDKYVRQ